MYAVSGTRNGKRKVIRTFKKWKYANRFKNLIKITGKEIKARRVYKNIRIKKL